MCKFVPRGDGAIGGGGGSKEMAKRGWVLGYKMVVVKVVRTSRGTLHRHV